MNKIYRPYIFIGDIIESEEKLPLNLFEDYYLKKASIEQIKYIKGIITPFQQTPNIKINLYEKDPVKNQTGIEFVHIRNQKQWKYFIIEGPEKNFTGEIDIILSLSSIDLKPLLKTFKLGNNIGYSGFNLRIVNFFHDFEFNLDKGIEPKRIDKASLEEFKRISSLYRTFEVQKNDFPNIVKSLEDFLKSGDISAKSPFKVLSYFSVLELLLVSIKPPEFPEASISSQLQNKINLLNNRFIKRIEVEQYFKDKNMDIGSVVKKLYEYRSQVAHGSFKEFSSSLQMFKGQEKNILPFLSTIIRSTLIKALEEPNLIADLKKC